MRLPRGLLLLVMLVVGSSALAREVPIRDFFKDPEFTSISLSPEDDRTILVERSIENAYLSKLDVYNGRVVTVATAPVEQGTFLVDHDRNVRFVSGAMNDGRNVTYRRDGDQWTKVHESERNGATYFPLGFAADNRHAYMAKGEGGKPESIVLLDTQTREETLLSSNGTVSPSGFVWSSDAFGGTA